MNKLLAFSKNNMVAIVLAIIPPLAIWYFFQRDTRDLSVTLATDVPVISIDRKLAPDIDVRYKGVDVKSLRVVDIVIDNTGNKAIQRNEFDTPLSFTFSGQILGDASLIRSIPHGLSVQFIPRGHNSIELTPLLLNSNDEIAFRVLLGNTTSEQSDVSVDGRIVGVSNIELKRDAAGLAVKGTKYELLFVVLLSLLSITAVIQIFRRAYELYKIKILWSTMQLEIGQPKSAGTQQQVNSLASTLGISKHDYKSNLLLLRLKIENQLVAIARAADLPDRDQIRSISRIAQLLAERKVLPYNVVTLIRGISGPINRELHELESYLRKEQFETLQNAALNAVAILENVYAQQINKRNT